MGSPRSDLDRDADLAGTVRELTSTLRAQSDLRPRVEHCEHDIENLKRPAR